jgi:hypothetical protein
MYHAWIRLDTRSLRVTVNTVATSYAILIVLDGHFL